MPKPDRTLSTALSSFIETHFKQEHLGERYSVDLTDARRCLAFSLLLYGPILCLLC